MACSGRGHWSGIWIINAAALMLQSNDAEVSETTVVTVDPINGYHSPTAVLATVQKWLKLKTVASLVSDKERDQILQRIAHIRVVSVECPPQRTGLSCGDRLVPLLVADD